MAWTDPNLWEFQDVLTLTHLQQLSDNNAALLAETYMRNTMTSLSTDMPGNEERLAKCHSLRYLFYRSAGAGSASVYPWPAPSGQDVVDNPENYVYGEMTSLPDTTGTGGGLVDLQSVEWLVPGMLYFITGVMWAFEIEVF